MAPSATTEDYYFVLGINQSATSEAIREAYKRLALKLHPNRNTKEGSTQAFQLLGQAYETLKDESKRRTYDLIYPSISPSAKGDQSTQTSRPSPTPHSAPASTQPSEAVCDAQQINALKKKKTERAARWATSKQTFDSSIFELQRTTRRIDKEVQNLAFIAAAEKAEDAQKNSWGTWLLSPLYKRPVETEEAKARKDRERQERRIEKDLKERRLSNTRAQLCEKESQLEAAKKLIDIANLADDRLIQGIEARARDREAWEQKVRELERERLEREKRAKAWKEQQEALDALRKRQEEQRKKDAQEADARRREQEAAQTAANRRFQEHPHFFHVPVSGYRARVFGCTHWGWWDRVQGRQRCPECDDVWTYLLECPSCPKKACPKCQRNLRPRYHRG